ncbi:hypothetical protein BCY91_07215 [Pelobium manganitolerans]|uniref:Uncharacterized protein n=1 Tax=Pelobium manganitolerans TaxID=1842495 RepID=A0A419S3S3_9SPHI|nr:hypothetical protein BCY91_07215 [Pelobium manganitolerans]
MKILKLLWATIFMVIIYITIAIAVKYYVDWVFNKNILWIIIITIFVITIPRIILNRIPVLIGNVRGSTETLMTLSSIMSWIFRGLYLIFIFFFTNIHSIQSIILSVFCYALYLGLCNFFAHGLVFHILKQDTNK